MLKICKGEEVSQNFLVSGVGTLPLRPLYDAYVGFPLHVERGNCNLFDNLATEILLTMHNETFSLSLKKRPVISVMSFDTIV